MSTIQPLVFMMNAIYSLRGGRDNLVVQEFEWHKHINLANSNLFAGFICLGGGSHHHSSSVFDIKNGLFGKRWWPSTMVFSLLCFICGSEGPEFGKYGDIIL